jgi:release factor glutamine methyltransferase
MSTDGSKTLIEVINATTTFFQQKGVDSPRLTIELMLAHVLNKKRLQLYLEFERRLDEPVLDKLREMVKRRGAGEPLQYILGKTEFHGLEFQVDKRVLIPRPETELLVEQVISGCKDAGTVRIHDIGTGSGCIAITLAKKLPAAHLTATDRSAPALELARKNAAANGVSERIRFVESDLFSAMGDQKFDWIVSNPPYIPASQANTLAREIRDHEPLEALFAGDDGLAIIRRIIAEAPPFLSPGGYVALEIGAGQSEAVQQLFRDAQYQVANVVKDLQNHERLVIATHG